MSDLPYLSGTDRPMPFAAQRVVCLVPSVSESLAELELADRLVGVADDAIHPEGGFPWAERVGPSALPDIDRILALGADLALIGPQHAPLLDSLRAADVPVWLTNPRTVRDVFNLLWDLMNALEAPQMVARVRAIEWTCDWLERLAETRSAQARVAALISRDPLLTVGAASYTHDLLRVCGGDSVFGANDVDVLAISTSDLVQAQPDIILLAESGDKEFRPADAETLAALDTPAGRQGRVLLVEGTLLTWAGTRVARALDELPSLLELLGAGDD